MNTILAVEPGSRNQTCPSWCLGHHRDDGEIVRHTGVPTVIAVFHDHRSLTVCAEQDVYLFSPPLLTPAVVRVGRDLITPEVARRMAEALVDAARLAEGNSR